MRNFITIGDKQVFFESRVNPVREAEKILFQVESRPTDVFILFGLTTGHVLSRLISMVSTREARPFILCVDPGPEMLDILKESTPELAEYPHIRFFNVQEPEKICAYIEEIFYKQGPHYPFHHKILKNLSITSNWNGEYNNAEKMIIETFRTLYSNLLVMDRFKHLWIANLIRNTMRVFTQEKNHFQSQGSGL